jgi:DNA polymerase I-like protein with 3'-5' exonuclease and polymerase domains
MIEEYSDLPLLNPKELNPPLNPSLITDGAGLEKVRSFISRVKLFGFDYETNFVKHFVDRRARTLQIGDKNEQYVIDLLAFAETEENLISQQAPPIVNGKMPVDLTGVVGPKLKPIIDVVGPALQSNSHLKVGQNLEFEYIVSRFCLGMRIWNLYGTDITEKLLLAGLVGSFEKSYFALDDLVAKYIQKRIDKTHQTGFDLKTPLTEEQVIYCALDTRLPLAIRIGQQPRIAEAKLEVVVDKVEMPAIPAFGDLNINGLYVDKDAWMNLVDTNRQQHTKNIQTLDTFFIPVVGKKSMPAYDLKQLEEKWRDLGVDDYVTKEIKAKLKESKDPEEKAKLRIERDAVIAERKERRKIAGEEFAKCRKHLSEVMDNWDKYEGEAAVNYGSNAQVRKALLEMKGINEKNLPDTNDLTLEKLAGIPVIDALREFRTTEKEIKNYGPEWVLYEDEFYIDPKDKSKKKFGLVNRTTDRIHSRFNQMGAATGRTSSSGPNVQNLKKDKTVRACFTAPPGYKTLTVDMSGAELRIIADYGVVKSWIDAFNKGWDVHSVGAEILYAKEWPEMRLPDCAYFTKDHQKCECPKHKELRDGNKSTNFLLAYGGGANKLKDAIKKTLDEAKALMKLHESKFPDVWNYLKRAGKLAVMKMEARSMSGRRRSFKRPTWEDAKAALIADRGENPTTQQISKKLGAMNAGIEREGKNMGIQGTNADMAKVGMGAGFDKEGMAFLWHILYPKYGALMTNFVHDEYVIWCPDEHAEECFKEVCTAIRRAGAEFLRHVVMEAEGHIDTKWRK